MSMGFLQYVDDDLPPAPCVCCSWEWDGNEWVEMDPIKEEVYDAQAEYAEDLQTYEDAKSEYEKAELGLENSQSRYNEAIQAYEEKFGEFK